MHIPKLEEEILNLPWPVIPKSFHRSYIYILWRSWLTSAVDVVAKQVMKGMLACKVQLFI
jgi:hypothetical protein